MSELHKIKLRYGRKVYHVRGIVDDQVICRFWRQTKQRWEYTAYCPVQMSVFFPDWEKHEALKKGLSHE